MSVEGVYLLSKGDVMMYLSLAGLRQSCAAALAGVSLRTFNRAMKRHRVDAPKRSAKLTTMEVREIRELLEKREQKAVAKMKGLHPNTVGNIARYETWLWAE